MKNEVISMAQDTTLLRKLFEEFKRCHEMITKKSRFEFVIKFMRTFGRLLLYLNKDEQLQIMKEVSQIIWDKLPERVKK